MCNRIQEFTTYSVSTTTLWLFKQISCEFHQVPLVLVVTRFSKNLLCFYTIHLLSDSCKPQTHTSCQPFLFQTQASSSAESSSGVAFLVVLPRPTEERRDPSCTDLPGCGHSKVLCSSRARPLLCSYLLGFLAAAVLMFSENCKCKKAVGNWIPSVCC